MKAIIAGPDQGLSAAFAEHGVETVRINGHVTGGSLDDAGVATADLLVLTDVAEATAVPVAKDVNPEIRVVIYSAETMPEFVRGQVDFAVSPELLSPAVIAGELAD